MAPPAATVTAADARPGRAASPPATKKQGAKTDENASANLQSVKDPKTARTTKASKTPAAAPTGRLARLACGALLVAALLVSATVGFYLGVGEVNSAELLRDLQQQLRDLLQRIPRDEVALQLRTAAQQLLAAAQPLWTAAQPLLDALPANQYGFVAAVAGISSVVVVATFLLLKLAAAGLRLAARVPGKLWAAAGKLRPGKKKAA